MISTRSSVRSASSPSSGYGDAPVQESTVRLQDYLVILMRNKGLIATITFLVVASTFAWVSTRTPSYRARATLLLEKDEAVGGVLSELASLTADPAAAAEIALLTSRSLAAVTAARPDRWNPKNEIFSVTEADFDPFAVTNDMSQAQGDPSAMERLGLNIQVHRHDLRPSAGIHRRLTGGELDQHRLYAQMDPIGAIEDPRPGSLAISFFEENGKTRVEVGLESRLLSGVSDGVSYDYAPDMTIDHEGWRLRLHAAGEFVGQSYGVSYDMRENAVRDLMNNVQAVESGRKTNVVYVYVNDADPSRAAETANALCKNYIRRNVGIGRQKATQTVRFIDSQLQKQIEALDAAEEKVVALQTEHPETIALSVSAEALIEQISAIELRRTQDELALRVIREALEYLEHGDFEALARLGGQIPNLLALSYIKELGQLEAESLRLDRSDVQGYKQLLTAERLRLQVLVDAARTDEKRLQGGFAALEAGDYSGIAQVGGTNGEGPFAEYLTEIAKIDGELSRTRGLSTEKNPKLRSLEQARTELLARLTEQVAGALTGLQTSIAGYGELIATYGESIQSWPTTERGTIDKAVQTLRERVRASL
ncbi:MAG: hypothetical protein ACI841_001684, partial [Planctomycetota bacterium]